LTKPKQVNLLKFIEQKVKWNTKTNSRQLQYSMQLAAEKKYGNFKNC